MKKVLLIIVSLVVGVLFGWYANSILTPPITPSASFAFNDRLSDVQVPFLSATGTWVGTDIANKINTVRIVCDGTTKTCDLNQADVVNFGGGPFLSLYYQSFRITQQTNSLITAVENLPSLCIRQTLLFDRQAKAVTLIRTKISKQEACSIVQDAPVTISLR